MSQQIPQMTFHKAGGQAAARLSGRDFYRGPRTNAAAKRTYEMGFSGEGWNLSC
jgi:hypothetical protein